MNKEPAEKKKKQYVIIRMKGIPKRTASLWKLLVNAGFLISAGEQTGDRSI